MTQGSSGESEAGLEQTHDEVDQRILEELIGRVYYDVGGFYARYFERKVWTNDARDIYEESRAQFAEGCWSGRFRVSHDHGSATGCRCLLSDGQANFTTYSQSVEPGLLPR
jgi:hypothetical protein